MLIYILIIGLLGGILSGAVGIGGGTLLVPAMVLLLQYSQKTAQGTTLAMLLFPVVALSVLNYHYAGHVQWRTAILLGLGFVAGGWLGSRFAVWIPDQIHLAGWAVTHPLKKLFAVFLIVVAIRMFLK